MKGPLNQDMLILAPDTQGNVAIVDPSLQVLAVMLNCPAFGSLNGIMVNPGTGAAYFISVAPASTPRPILPLGTSELVLYGITPDLQLATPYPLPDPPTWTGSTQNAGISFMLLNAGTQGSLLATVGRS